MDTVIEVNHLYKAYGDVVAVDDVSFAVRPGEIFAILGPNGAGKSTTVENLMGLRQPDRGTVRVLGLDPQRQRHELSRRIGIQLQQAALPDRLRVWEALDLFASFYDHPLPWDPLLEQWGLAEKRNTPFVKLSGGQKQRLFIALVRLNDPDSVFLDDVTTGLDPAARRATWEMVKAIRTQGKTVVLVTHFMDEAQVLADRVAIFDHGRIVALDTPAALIRSLQQDKQVRFATTNGFDPRLLSGVAGVNSVAQEGDEYVVRGTGPLLARVETTLAAAGVDLTDIHMERATLEDVFLTLTGRRIRD